VFAPLKVSPPEPAFVRLNPPEITPLKTTSLFVVTTVFAPNDPAPLKVNPPLFVECPSVTAVFNT
jgi:hypothetical protein